MKILIATDHYPPFIGGAQRQTQLLAEGLVERGHEVSVATPWSGGLPRFESSYGVSVHRIRQVRTILSFLIRDEVQRHQTPFPDPVTVLGLRRLIAKTQPDLIHTYGWFSFSVAAAIGRRKIPLLGTGRDYANFCATRTLIRKGELCSGPAPVKCLGCAEEHYGAPKGWIAAAGVLASRPLLERKLTGMHTVSSYVTGAYSQHLLGPVRNGRPRALEMTIPDMQAPVRGEDTSEQNPAVAEVLSQLPEDPFMLFVGAFRKVKGLETIFAAYRRLEDPPPLVLMGTFERDSPEDFPPEAIVLTDVPHAAVMASWDRALFGVLPSIWPEPLAGTVHEALSNGRAVIATQIGGMWDMVDEHSGILVPPGDDVALAAAMARLIADPELRASYGESARKRIRKMFAPENVVPQYVDAYREVIAAGRARSG